LTSSGQNFGDLDGERDARRNDRRLHLDDD
jgi:hypothetical protein